MNSKTETFCHCVQENVRYKVVTGLHFSPTDFDSNVISKRTDFCSVCVCVCVCVCFVIFTYSYFMRYALYSGEGGYTLTQSVRHWSRLRYFYCYLSLILPFGPHCDPGLSSASNRNDYHGYFLKGTGGRCVGLTTLPFPCADWKFGDPEPPGAVRACPGTAVP